jgi:hypothetical protein
MFAGLIYPIAVALMTFIIGSIKLKETKDVKLWDELDRINISSNSNKTPTLDG